MVGTPHSAMRSPSAAPSSPPPVRLSPSPPSDAAPSRVLVLGGTQFIGRATVAALIDAGHSVTIVNRGRSPNPFGSRVRHVVCDRRDTAAIAAVVRSGAPWGAVLDFLAFCPSDADPFVCQSGLVGLYVLISTDSVYMACDPASFVRHDGRLLEGSDVKMDDARAAADEYGADKLRLERRLRSSDLRFVALRLPDVLGPHENTGRQRKLLQRLVKGRRIGAAICEGDGEPSQPLGLVFCEDVAAAILKALEQPADALAGRSIHICCAEAPTWAELVRIFAEALRSHGVEVPKPQFDDAKDTGMVSVDFGALSGAAACTLLGGWRPSPLTDAVDRCVSWWVGTMWEEFEAQQRNLEAAEGQDSRVLRQRPQ